MRPVPGEMITPGARAPIRLLRFCAAAFCVASGALIVVTALPIERRASPPAVPVTTTLVERRGLRLELEVRGRRPGGHRDGLLHRRIPEPAYTQHLRAERRADDAEATVLRRDGADPRAADLDADARERAVAPRLRDLTDDRAGCRLRRHRRRSDEHGEQRHRSARDPRRPRCPPKQSCSHDVLLVVDHCDDDAPFHAWPRTMRPGLAPVCRPSRTTSVPLMKTSRAPIES
jgi:hypothetical protein